MGKPPAAERTMFLPSEVTSIVQPVAPRLALGEEGGVVARRIGPPVLVGEAQIIVHVRLHVLIRLPAGRTTGRRTRMKPLIAMSIEYMHRVPATPGDCMFSVPRNQTSEHQAAWQVDRGAHAK